jgi:hypothetical protein
VVLTRMLASLADERGNPRAVDSSELDLCASARVPRPRAGSTRSGRSRPTTASRPTGSRKRDRRPESSCSRRSARSARRGDARSESGREVAAPYMRTLELSNWLAADARGFVPWGVAHNLQGARHLDARIRGQVLHRLVVGTFAAHARDVRSRALSIDEPCELTVLQTHRRGPPKRPLPSCGRRRGRHEPKQPGRWSRYWRVRSEAAPEPYEGLTFVRRTYRPWTGRPYPEGRAVNTLGELWQYKVEGFAAQNRVARRSRGTGLVPCTLESSR